MYVVVLLKNNNYEFNKNAHDFTTWTAAYEYCSKLNRELAEEKNCKIKELNDRYIIVEVA